MTELKTDAKTVPDRYMNLRNDWGFKFVFSKKKYLISFLNEILQEKEKIIDVTYLPTEQLGKTEEDRRAIFDIYCRNEQGELILLEMQNRQQIYFHERSLFYSAHLIQSQAQKGKWNYKLKKIYVIGILNFKLFPDEKNGHYIEPMELVRKHTKESISDTLAFIYIELPKFKKRWQALRTAEECWIYIIKHSKKMLEQPATIQGELFDSLFKDMELKRLTASDMELYTKSDLRHQDFPSYNKFYELRGMEKGLIKGEKRGILKGRLTAIKEMAAKFLQLGVPIDNIAKATGLTPAQIKQIKIQTYDSQN